MWMSTLTVSNMETKGILGESRKEKSTTRLCVESDRSKLIMVGTPEIRTAILTDQLSIKVDGQEIKVTESKKKLLVLLTTGCYGIRTFMETRKTLI